jgi:hypothetical protein
MAQTSDLLVQQTVQGLFRATAPFHPSVLEVVKRRIGENQGCPGLSP